MKTVDISTFLTGVDYIRHICSERKLSVSQLEKDLNFSNGYFNPKKLKRIPYDRAVAVANYLDVPIEPILGIDNSTKSSIKNLRSHLGYSQEEFAEKAGVSRSTVAMWETGKSHPTHNTVVEMAQRFSIPIDAFFSFFEEPANSTCNYSFSSRLKELRQSHNLTQEELADILQIDRSSVGKYETGTMPSTNVLILIANHFSVSLDYLVGLGDSIVELKTRLREARESLGYTQEYVANHIGISRQALSNYENDNREADYETLILLSDLYSVSIDYLLKRDTNVSDPLSSSTEERNVFAKTLRALRKERGYTQKEFAEKLSIPANTYNQWENGKREPDFRNLILIANTLHVSVDYLLGVIDDPMSFLILDDHEDPLVKAHKYVSYLAVLKKAKR